MGQALALVLDDSSNNPLLTRSDIKLAGACAVISKGSEGSWYHNPLYLEQRQLALSAGVPFGSYVFLHSGAKGSEADYFVEHARPHPDDIMPVIDAEVLDGGTYADMAARLDACARRLEKLGYPCMVYSGQNFSVNLLEARPSLKRLPWWEAQYPGHYTRWFPWIAKQRMRIGHGVSVKMWQWTDAFQVGTKHYDASRLFVPIESLLIKNNL